MYNKKIFFANMNNENQNKTNIETLQPFYGDILAKSLLRIGITKYEAYKIAQKIKISITSKNKKVSMISHLEIAKEVKKILQESYPYLVDAYENWRKITKRDNPLIILLGGGTGIGTSTLAIRIAWLMDISRIVSTDSVREVIRQFLPQRVLPLLNVSTYETGEYLPHVKSHHDAVVYGFLSQSKKVLYGVEAVIKRAIKENESLIIEGIHLIPGELESLKELEKEAIILPLLLDIKSKNVHLSRFSEREMQSSARKEEKYVKHFKEIRMIRDFLVKEAKNTNVQIIQNLNLRNTEKIILEKIYESFIFKK